MGPMFWTCQENRSIRAPVLGIMSVLPLRNSRPIS